MDATWLEALDEDAGLNTQVDHLQNNCTFCVDSLSKKIICIGTGDGKRMMATNGGRNGGGDVLKPLGWLRHKTQRKKFARGLFSEVCAFVLATTHTLLIGLLMHSKSG